MKKISIVVACYNESENILALYQRVKNVFKDLNYNFEIIYVDNASIDNSEKIFENLAQADSRIKVIFMSRNFGSSQPSLLAGLRRAIGDSVVFLDGDLQDPPELILDFVEKWEQHYDVVYAVRKKRKGSILRRIGYKIFYRIFKWLSYIDIPVDAGDCCLIDRKIVDILKNMQEKDLYIRGLRAWVGFKQTGIEYTREDRFTGKTSCNFFANFFWAKKAIVNFSYKPLELISKLASLTVFMSIIALFFYIYFGLKYSAPRGFTTLLVVVLFLGAIQLLSLSIIGEYLARMFEEVKGRPHYIIRKELNLDNSPEFCIENKNSFKNNNLENT
ncbi:glycosyltransferase family 2 protein [Candidatus Babeliales bacterium]|nr:glycosyltransferase family 2 protein [Candidatus Babeliales bacterium]